MNIQQQNVAPITLQPDYAGSKEITRRGGSIIFPVLLIALGMLFLLNTIGVIGWGVWDAIWRLWPVILVAIGLEILLGRRSALAEAVVTIVLLLAVAAGIAIWVFQPFGGQVLNSDNVSQSLQGAAQADVDISFGVGTLRIGALTGSGDLISGTVNRPDNEKLSQSFYNSGNTAYYTLKSETDWTFPFFTNGQVDRTWELKLNPGVPTNLRVDAGLGNAELDLERLNLTRLDLNSGTGNMSVTLPAQGSFSGKISGGLGNLDVSIPQGSAVRIKATSGLGQQQMPAAYQQSDNVYESPNYSTATDRVDLEINSGVGNLTVHEVQKTPLP